MAKADRTSGLEQHSADNTLRTLVRLLARQAAQELLREPSSGTFTAGNGKPEGHRE